MAGSVTCWLILGLVALGVPKNAYAQEKVRVFGDRFRHPLHTEEWVRTYVDMPKDHDGDTNPLAVGLQMTPGFIRAANDLPVVVNSTAVLTGNKTVDVPGSGNTTVTGLIYPFVTFENYRINFPRVGRNPFTFAALTYNFYGHVPVGIYDYEHFDVRFFMVDPDWWWNEQYPADTFLIEDGVDCGFGTPDRMFNAEQPIPLDCWPGDPTYVQNVGHYLWGQGSHIYNLAEPGWQAWGKGSSVNDVDSFTFGMQAGSISYIETMFSRKMALTPDLKDCMDFKDMVPKHFDTERPFPTRKCLVAGPGSTVKLEYTGFVDIPGGCQDMRNGTLVGWFPLDVADILYTGCKVPVPP